MGTVLIQTSIGISNWDIWKMSLRMHYEVSFYRKEAHGSTSKDTKTHRAHSWFLTQPLIDSKPVHLVSTITQETNLGSLSITSQASEEELPNKHWHFVLWSTWGFRAKYQCLNYEVHTGTYSGHTDTHCCTMTENRKLLKWLRNKELPH